VTRFRFVEAEAAQFPVSLLCKTMGVTRQGFYAWRKRPPSVRELADRKLCERIREIHTETEGAYGAPRIYNELRLGDGIAVGKKRVARLMRQLGIKGADGKRGGPRTTVRDPKRVSAPDLVDRDFARAEPNRLWVCDLKYVQTGQGFLFLAVVQDVFSRRIIGWSMRDNLQAELVLDALGMAVSTRGPAAGVVAHSDQGSQGGFNSSSQHLVMEVVRDGWWQASAGDSRDARSDVVAGPAVGGAAGGSAAVLAGDRGWVFKRGRGRRGGRVASGWRPVVPRRWWDAANLVGPAVGALFVVC
jgi:Integrase core domain/HTH-like domain